MTIELLRWEHRDMPTLVNLANNRQIWNRLKDAFPHPYTSRDAEEWIDAQLAMEPPRHFSIVLDGEVVGGVGIELKSDVHRKTAEIGCWVGEAYWNRGIATQAIGLMVTYAFDRFDLVKIYAEVFELNPASMRIFEKNGFIREAILRKAIVKNNEIMDAHIWAIFRSAEAKKQ
jgi:RimJ/RimL family protein N-acetyltransferase